MNIKNIYHIFKNIVKDLQHLDSQEPNILPLRIKVLQKGRGREIGRYNYQKEYVDFNIQDGDKVLDIGAGINPFPLATHLADLNAVLDLTKDSRPFTACDIENLPFHDKEFDFIYCSHVLEHTENPARACEELMRVGKMGYIETPTRTSDIMFNITAMQPPHKWFVSLIGNNTLIFIECQDAEKRNLGSYFFSEFQSKWANAFQDLVYKHRDLFVNMLLWTDKFYYFIFDKNGSLLKTNKTTK